jgi:hypothetical protein
MSSSRWIADIAVVSMNWEDDRDELSLALPKRAGIAARLHDAGAP